jgi:hypothetical protein
MNSLVNFWSEMPSNRQKRYVHPRDRRALSRLDNHIFDLRALPSNFQGPIKTARVVLLFLSPGFHQKADHEEASKYFSQYLETLQGNAPLRDGSVNPAFYSWWKSRTRCFGLPDDWVRHNLSVLNIGAYHSVAFRDKGALTSLPSSRAALQYAQETLFPQAERGTRTAICLRAHEYWGLTRGRRYGRGLFVPHTTRGGYMRKDVSEQIIDHVRHHHEVG